MLTMLFVLLVTVGNLALGFGLAVHLGYGPTGWEIPSPEKIRTRLQGLLRLKK
jgi:hypothetical protein